MKTCIKNFKIVKNHNFFIYKFKIQKLKKNINLI